MSSVFLIIPAVIGWLSGWLVNYFSDVLPTTRQLSQPNCLKCGVPFTWKDYLLFRPCPNGHRRNLRAWFVQVLAIVTSLYLWIYPPSKLGYIIGLILTIYFGIIFVIDLEHRLILHPTSIFGSLLGLFVGTLSHGFFATLLGGLGGLLIMLIFYLLGVLFTRIRLRRLQLSGQPTDDEEALGAGDVILSTIIGLMLGWPLIWFGILVGVLLGGAVSILLILWLVITRKYEKNALMVFIPYGPYLILSAFLILYFPKYLAVLVP